MNHSEAQARMMEALDGALSPAGRSALDAHLSGCAECRASWERLQNVDRVLADAAERRAPAGFSRRVMARLDDPQLAEAWASARGPEDWARAGLGLLVLALGGLGVTVWAVVLLAGQALPLLQFTSLPQQLPVLVNLVWNWVVLATALAGLFVSVIEALNEIVAANPILLTVAVVAVAIVALWAWMLQRLAGGQPTGRLTLWML